MWVLSVWIAEGGNISGWSQSEREWIARQRSSQIQKTVRKIRCFDRASEKRALRKTKCKTQKEVRSSEKTQIQRLICSKTRADITPGCVDISLLFYGFYFSLLFFSLFTFFSPYSACAPTDRTGDAATRGRTTVNTDPSPGAPLAVMVPCKLSTIFLHSANPRPFPLERREVSPW